MEKKYKFPSEEWVKAFQEEINKSEEYAKAAKDWEGDFLFIVLPDEKYDKEFIFYMDLWHGKCRDAYVVASRDEKKTEFVYEGPYKNWVKLIHGELDPIRSIITRHFRLRGSMVKVMRYTKAAAELVKCISRIPTEFIA